MSAAQILKSMKGAPKLEKSTYNRWSTHFLDVLSLFEVDNYLLVEKPELSSRKLKSIPENHLSVCKQDRNIREAISQLVPDIAFHLVDSTYTSKQCWENLRQFFCPNSAEDVDDLLQQFWSLYVEDDVDIDDFVQKLSEIKGKISLIHKNSTPHESSMKKRLLSHFIKCCSSFYMSTVVSLRDPKITLESAISSIRESQSVYRELNPPSIIALASGNEDKSSISPNSSDKNGKKKTCAHCRRRGHIRESCFLWLETADGSRWASKNPEKAKKLRKLKEKLQRRSRKPNQDENKFYLEEPNQGAWIIEDYALLSKSVTKSLDVILDTGATHHIFHDRKMFTSLLPTNKSICTASGQSISVSGIGNVTFKVFSYDDENLSKDIEINIVWYVPSCTKNLVSGIQLFSRGLNIHTSNKGLSIISNNGGIIATARPRNGLFCFNTYSSSNLESSFETSSDLKTIFLSKETIKMTTELIHQRFAHAGSHLLKNIDISKIHIPSIKPDDKRNFLIEKSVLIIQIAICYVQLKND